MADIVKLRQQGGAAILTVPAHFLRKLAIGIGSELSVDISDGKLVVQPVPAKAPLPRRTLAELLMGAEHAASVHEETRWARDGDPVGKEIA